MLHCSANSSKTALSSVKPGDCLQIQNSTTGTVLSTERTINNLLWQVAAKLKPLSCRDFRGSAQLLGCRVRPPETRGDDRRCPPQRPQSTNAAPHKLPELDELCHFLLMQGDLAAFVDLAGCCLTMSGKAHATSRSLCLQSKRACPCQRAQYFNKSLEIPAGCWPPCALLNSIQTREGEIRVLANPRRAK
jgi:hypothetical protein